MVSSRIDKTRKSYLVIGLGYFGEAIATKLYDLGQEVVGVETDPEIVQRLADKLTQAIQMDARMKSLSQPSASGTSTSA